MLIDSAVFGSLEVDEDQIFHMTEGPLGFPGNSRYALITKQEDDITLMWFQAVDAKVPCFIVFDPHQILEDYSPVMENRDLKALECHSSSDLNNLRYLVIAVVPEDISKTTVNLKSPIVLNLKTRTARQVILSNINYPIQFFLAPTDMEDSKQVEKIPV